MRKVIILFCFFICFLKFSLAQWIPLNSGTKFDLRSICFTDVNTGYAVGGSDMYYKAVILKTTNAGATWDTVYYNDYSPILMSIFFINKNIGWALGGHYLNESIFLKTTNGGLTWTPINNVLGGIIQSIYMNDTNIGHIVNYEGNIANSTDGWMTLILQVANTYCLYSICFTNPSIGYVVGGDITTGAVLKTIDGGSNWTKKVIANSYNLYSICFTDSNTAYVSGYGNNILKTTDAGVTWNLQLTGSDNHLWKVFFADTLTGYVVGCSANTGGVILKTTDGGVNWSSQNLGFSKMLYSVYFTSKDTGYAVGDSGVILKTTNGGGVGVSEISNNNQKLLAFPNPATNQTTINYQQLIGEGELTIYNILGQLIQKEKLLKRTFQKTLNIQNFKAGLYKIIVKEKGIIKGQVSLVKE